MCCNIGAPVLTSKDSAHDDDESVVAVTTYLSMDAAT